MTTTLNKIIGENGLLIDGDWIESKDQDINGSVRIIQLADIGDGYFINKSNRFLTMEKAIELKCTFLEPGDLLIARMPDPIGRACVFPGMEMPCVTVVDICILRPNNKEIYAPWTKFLINSFSFRNRITKYISGTTRQRISRGNLEKIDFSLFPVADQIKIAKILSCAEELIEERKRSIHLLDEFLKSKFWDMFVRNNKYTSWDNYHIKELVEDNKHAIKAGPFGSSLKKEYYVESGYKIYGQEQVIKDDFDYGDYYIDEQLYKKLESCKIKAGDVLISLVGTFGKISIVPDTFEPGIINPRLMKISFDKEKINAIFFKHLFQFPLMQRNILSVSRGGTMGILNVGIVKELKMICPPLPLQNQFAAIVKEVESIKKDYKQSLSELENLYGSLSQRAFKGELDLSRLDITEELKAHEESILQYEEQEKSSRPEVKEKGKEIKHIEDEEDENLKASIIHAALDWPIESEVFNTEQIANLLKEKYTGFHFSFEMAYRYLSKRIKNIESHYFYSEELLADPGLKNEANFKDFFQSALQKENQFIELKQQFYNSKEENFDLQLTADDYDLWKDKKDRSGIYFSIK